MKFSIENNFFKIKPEEGYILTGRRDELDLGESSFYSFGMLIVHKINFINEHQCSVRSLDHGDLFTFMITEKKENPTINISIRATTDKFKTQDEVIGKISYLLKTNGIII